MCFPAAPDQREVGDSAAEGVPGCGVHHGHRQGRAVGSDLRPRQPRHGHICPHLVAPGQFQLPARRVRQPRRSEDGEAIRLPAHHFGPLAQHGLQSHRQGQEHPRPPLPDASHDTSHPGLPELLLTKCPARL